MGTRNLTIIFDEGEVKLAKYCQWDGYPDGQGLTALSAVNQHGNRIRENLHLIQEATEADIQSAIRAAHEACEEEYEEDSPYMGWEVGRAMTRLTPLLTRDSGTIVLEHIANATEQIVIQNMDDWQSFAEDSLFCEWIWLINFDEQRLEAYGSRDVIPEDLPEPTLYTMGVNSRPCVGMWSFANGNEISEEQFVQHWG